ncbi:MAG: selenide, water dikinase SelD [Planctomycetota bacterium]|nr:MAG: selenide, water dikinase SelD [Planctomycetota bacterium]
MREDFVYLDYNATTPVDPRVAEAMRPYLTGFFGNPSSMHRLGREARAAVERARAQVAACVGAEPEEIIFTSGGTEANNLAIRGAVEARGGGHVVTSALEHPAVLEVVRALEAEGKARLTVVGVDRRGRVDPAEVERALSADTVLVTVMLANNEVGTIQPVAEIAAMCRERGILVHTDAAQAVGKIPVDVRELDVDMLSIAGHKLYAPKGVGALFVRRGVKLAPVLRGAGHERGLRPGTENVLEQVGLGAACELAAAEVEEEAARLRELRRLLLDLLREGFPSLVVHGDFDNGLPNTLSAAFPGVDAGLLLARLADEVGASAGAACHTGEAEPSHVLAAMGVDTATALCTVRLSLGRFSTEDEVRRGAEKIIETAREIAAPSAAPSAVEGGEVRLTAYTHGMGCACKMEARMLERVLRSLPICEAEEAVVGPETADDACAWRIGGGKVLVQSLDFFTPVVDSPRLFGAIAAANALSDIYAMGARPLFALNIAAFPAAVLPEEVLREMMEGALEVAEEAGIPILGGHTVEDNEPKFGLAVTGMAEESGLWRNRGARPGDALILTKPLGTGIWATAAKRGVEGVEGWGEAVAAMRTLNRAAAEALAEHSPHAVTDVTGFGLLGHLHEMLDDSLSAELWAEAVPVLPGAERLAAMGEVPGGTKANLAWAEAWTRWEDGVDEVRRVLLGDAQTSGGLLAAVDRERAEAACEAMRAKGIRAAVIGRFTDEGEGIVRVLAGRRE